MHIPNKRLVRYKRTRSLRLCDEISVVSLRTLTSFLLIGWLLLHQGVSANADQRPNIVLLMGDDHGWDETGYNGHPFLQTPALDDMAANGLQIDTFYAAHPSCSPTRGSVLTGRHPNRFGCFRPGYSIRPEEICIAEMLSNAGYNCAHFGKWHVGPVKAASPTNPGAMGFTHWLSHDNFFEMNPSLSLNGSPPQRYVGEGSEVLIREALKYVSQAKDDDKPFFVVIWYGSPHEPYSGLPDDLALYNEVPDQFKDRTCRLTSNETGLQVVRPLGDVLRERYAEITAMDRSIGQLREWLTLNGLRDNTLVWYCGDNGSYTDGGVTSLLRGHKGTIYQGGVRVPCVIEWPARFPTQRVPQINAVTSDIMPTLCDLLDLPLPDRPLDGESLIPLFTHSKKGRDKPICFWDFRPANGALDGLEPYIDPKLQEGTTPLVKLMAGLYTRNFQNVRITRVDEQFYSGPRAILDKQFKLVIDGESGGPAVQLFDLEQDPLERTSIREKRPILAAELEKKLRQWQESIVTSMTGADYR